MQLWNPYYSWLNMWLVSKSEANIEGTATNAVIRLDNNSDLQE
jgi:hypothetical protein